MAVMYIIFFKSRLFTTYNAFEAKILFSAEKSALCLLRLSCKIRFVDLQKQRERKRMFSLHQTGRQLRDSGLNRKKGNLCRRKSGDRENRMKMEGVKENTRKSSKNREEIEIFPDEIEIFLYEKIFFSDEIEGFLYEKKISRMRKNFSHRR
jgi:hypothetical protein